MATSKKVEEKTEKKASPVLKKRTAPGETKPVEVKEKVSPLKKRELPKANEAKEEKPSKVILPKRVSLTEETEKPSKEKSSLDMMRERIAAQKKLEQDMMTKQALRNQEKDNLRGKLRELSRDLEEDEVREITPKAKPAIEFDLKSEALETQNKKLKNDVEKLKQQLQALLTLEFHNMKVLDPHNLTLSNEFVESINIIKEQVEQQKNNEEQTLKDELTSLQKELSNLKAKHDAAKKASEEAQRVATQAQRAVNQAKKAIEEQENDQVRDFKKEISSLEKTIKDKEKELADIKLEKDSLVEQHKNAIKELKDSLENTIKELNKEIKAKEKQIEKLNESKTTLTADKQSAAKENKKLLTQIENLKAKLAEADNVWQEKLDKEIALQEKQIKELEAKNKKLQKAGASDEVLVKEKKQLEDKLLEQTNKIDELLMNYQVQLDEKDKDLDALRKEVIQKEKEIKALKETVKSKPSDDAIQALKDKISDLEKQNSNLSKLQDDVKILTQNVSTSSEKELKEKCDNYQALLLSERNSHLQVEQKLCKDLDDYKLEIEKLQAQITNMSSNFGLTRLNQQVDVIEKYINELKENNNNFYNEYYEKLINDYKQEQVVLMEEIEKRNEMLTLIRDEKINVINILKKSGKNAATIEKQVEDINALISIKVQPTTDDKSAEIENEILNSIKEDLLSYCDNIKNQALQDIEKINQKYESAQNVSSLIKEYNEDCENMAREYSVEISKLNFERELNKDANIQNAIEEKILMIERQYCTSTTERDRIFNEAMSKLRTQSFEIVKEQLSNNYFAFVGEEYIKSLNKYAEMKVAVEEKIQNQNNKYQTLIQSLKQQESELLEESKNIKEAIAALNNKNTFDGQEVNEKQSLLEKLENNELKLQNLQKYGFNRINEDNQIILSQLQEDYANIVEEEKKLKELYIKRETEAKNRLVLEKAKEEEADKANVKQSINDYIYIQEETERIIESVQEKREKLQVKQNEEVIIAEPKEQLSRIKVEDFKQVDYEKINGVQKEIEELKYRLSTNQNTELELQDHYQRHINAQKQLANDFKDIRKYHEMAREYSLVRAEAEKIGKELSVMDIKADKKAYKAKRAEYKSMSHKADYLEKHLRLLKKNKHVSEYINLVNNIKGLQQQISAYQKRNDELNLLISQKEEELNSLKG